MSEPDTLTRALLAACLLERGHGVRLRVHGGSMAPAVRDGDVVELVPSRERLPRPGEIVFVRRPQGGFMLHRVVRVLPGARLQTRGDALWRLDPPVEGGQVLGTMVGGWRGRRRLRMAGPLAGVARAYAMLVASRLRNIVSALLRRWYKARATGA